MTDCSNKIGKWAIDDVGLPCFEYTGELPYNIFLENGRKVNLPEDPWFLLGNYQFTLFAHVSGEYELITGQRAWGRMNKGKKINSGINNSIFKNLNTNKEYELVGINAVLSKREFGCGFANFTYNIDDIVLKRNLAVKPSTNPDNGTSAFLLTVTISNNSSEKIDFVFTESITANYEEIQMQSKSVDKRIVNYKNDLFLSEKDLIGYNISSINKDPMLFKSSEEMSLYEGFPPSLFMKSLSKDIELREANENEIEAKFAYTLEPNSVKEISLIIGYFFEEGICTIDNICNELAIGKSDFAEEWLKVLPKFEEDNKNLSQELIWHAYNLEAMATYSNYYKETKIPQGTIYDYDWGAHASARDNFQHALPLIYYNPKLAKSVLRYMLKRTTSFGDIRLIEKGYGYGSNERYFTSDQQLFFFLLFSEYLRVTKDYEFLIEEVEYYPVINGATMKVVDFVEKCFVFLRDEIGIGEHGLVRLMNSDWNDAVYYIVDVPYNRVLFTGESHMNSAMAISTLQFLIPELIKAKEIKKLESIKSNLEILCQSMNLYRTNVLGSFIKDLGNRSFPRRMYFNSKSYGDENMFLEPQGYTLLIDEFSDEYKINLYNEMLKRVYSGEKLGAREQEKPEFEDEHFDKGSRENGGFWWALNGPVIMGMSKLNKEIAMKLLKDMTFENYRNKFPQYWTSYWSAADNIESSLIPEEGLPDQSANYASIPVYCAHPHAWILYCYYYISEK